MKIINLSILGTLVIFYSQITCAQTAFQAEEANVIYNGAVETKHMYVIIPLKSINKVKDL